MGLDVEKDWREGKEEEVVLNFYKTFIRTQRYNIRCSHRDSYSFLGTPLGGLLL